MNESRDVGETCRSTPLLLLGLLSVLTAGCFSFSESSLVSQSTRLLGYDYDPNVDPCETNPSPSCKPPAGEDSLTVRLTDRRHVRSMLSNAFSGEGTSLGRILEDRVWRYPQAFGFGCDNYQWDDPVCGKIIWNGSRDIDKQVVNTSPVGMPLVGRFALTMRACEMILGGNYNGNNADNSLRNFANQLSANVDRVPSAENIKAAWGYFYPGVEPSVEVLNALNGVVRESTTTVGSNQPREAWKYLTYTLCISPAWHVL